MPLVEQRTQLSLIHIPLHLYSNFHQSILRLLLPLDTSNEDGPRSNGNKSNPWACDHEFTNISVTPVECSIVCSRESAERIFVPVINKLTFEQQKEVSITGEDYVVIQVEGEGLGAGQRVLELTSPLAMAGMYGYHLIPLLQHVMRTDSIPVQSSSSLRTLVIIFWFRSSPVLKL